MLKSTMPEQNAERAKQAANYGMDWIRQLVEETSTRQGQFLTDFLPPPAKQPTVSISKRRRSGNDPCPWQPTRSRTLWILRIGL